MTEHAARRQAHDEDRRTDRELVYAARDGDMLAFDALFYRYRDGIFRLGLAITKDPSAAEEIAVDTFTRAHRALARLEPEGSLRPWLYRVAVNLSYNRRPRKGVIISPLEDSANDTFQSEERSPSVLAEQAELRRIVLAAVDTLGPKHRIVVVLHYMNGLNLAEIALRRLRAHLSAHPEFGIEPMSFLVPSSKRMVAPVVEPIPGEPR